MDNKNSDPAELARLLDDCCKEHDISQNELETVIATLQSGRPQPSAGVILDDGDRLLIGTSFESNPAKIRDFGALVDGQVAGALHARIASGSALEAMECETRDLLDAVQPRDPVEATVLRSMQLSSAQQRQLLDLSATAGSAKDRIRYAELGLRAAREVGRAAGIWRTLRLPAAVHVGPGGQANVVGGNQYIQNGQEEGN